MKPIHSKILTFYERWFSTWYGYREIQKSTNVYIYILCDSPEKKKSFSETEIGRQCKNM